LKFGSDIFVVRRDEVLKIEHGLPIGWRSIRGAEYRELAPHGVLALWIRQFDEGADQVE
jgi:hypothetical protein